MTHPQFRENQPTATGYPGMTWRLHGSREIACVGTGPHVRKACLEKMEEGK